MSEVSTAKDIVINLTPNKGNSELTRNGDYTKQIVTKFGKLLLSDKELKAEFDQIETDAVGPKDERSGKYMGVGVNPFILHMSENVDFGEKVGTRDFTQLVVLNYFFTEGFHKGMEISKGVFALFRVTGSEHYQDFSDDSSKLLSQTVTAKFIGFSKTLNAEQGTAANP